LIPLLKYEFNIESFKKGFEEIKIYLEKQIGTIKIIDKLKKRFENNKKDNESYFKEIEKFY